MATLRNKGKLVTVLREAPENTRKNQSQNTINRGVAEEYITHVSEETGGRVTKKLSQSISWTDSRILGALSKLHVFLLNPHVRTCSVAVPGISRNNNSENWEPTGNHFSDEPGLQTAFSACHTSNLDKSEQDETRYSVYMLHRLNLLLGTKLGFFIVRSSFLLAASSFWMKRSGTST